MDGFSQSAPSLKVLAPTSQLSGARERTASPTGTKSPVRVSAHQQSIPRPTPAKSRNEFGIEVCEAAESTQQSSFLDGPIRGTPSLLFSMVVHLALILILAFCTYGASKTGRHVVLEFADAPAELDVMVTEIEFEDVVLEESTELEPSESAPLNDDLPMIPMEMMEDIADVEPTPSEFVELDFLAQNKVAEASGGENGAGNDGKVGSGKQQPGAEFFGTQSYGSKFVFVIDCSSSMTGRRWYRAVKELQYAIDRLQPDQEFLVLLYNTRMSVMMDVDIRNAALVHASTANKRSGKKWLRKQRTQGGTYPAQSMLAALHLRPDAIFLLSDGELQDNTMGLLGFWNVPVDNGHGHKTKIPIHTISLGQRGQGQEIMRTIANENEGQFTWIQ